MTSLRSTYAAGDHPHATCVVFFSLPPTFPSSFSSLFSSLLFAVPSYFFCSPRCPPLFEYVSSSSTPSFVLFPFRIVSPVSLPHDATRRDGSSPLRIYELTRLYKWTFCSFLGQCVARGSCPGVVCRLVCVSAPPVRRREHGTDNRKW